MTADAHANHLKEQAVQEVVSAGKSGNYNKYRDALYQSFHIRFIERRTPMLVTNIQAWVKDQIGACSHAFTQDQACTN